MRLKEIVALPCLLLITAAAGSAVSLAGEGIWSAELRATSIIPLGADGELMPVAGLGSGNRTEIDVLDGISPELALTAAVGRAFDLSVAVGMSEQDVELDVFGGGELPLGSVDAIHVRLSGMFDVAEWNRSALAIGPVVAISTHDNVDLDARARADEGVVAAKMDTATMLGVEARLDTAVGSRGWFFSSNLRYLVGDSQLDVFTDSDASGPSTSGRVLAATGDAALDPLIVSFGFGRKFFKPGNIAPVARPGGRRGVFSSPVTTRNSASSTGGGSTSPPHSRPSPPRAKARHRQLPRSPGDPMQVNLRWLVLLILLTVILPTIVLTGIGIAVIVARRAPFDLVFGLLVVVFAASVIAGSSLLMILARRGARLARLQETFLSRIGHELMTPIAGIRLHGEILESTALPAEADESVRAIRKESERLQSLVERIMRWRSVRSPEHLYDRAPTTADQIVERALDRLHDRDGISVEIREHGLPLHADAEALAEALANLLQNAQKYAGSAGPVELLVRRWTRWALFSVGDRGPGLPALRPERVFLPFFREIPAGRSDPGGSGLGLTIARQVALAHGGRLNATDRRGGGARFTLVIPLHGR